MAAAPGTIPTDWMALRDRWEMGHAIRFALQLTALGLLVLSLLGDPAPGPPRRPQRDGYPHP